MIASAQPDHDTYSTASPAPPAGYSFLSKTGVVVTAVIAVACLVAGLAFWRQHARLEAIHPADLYATFWGEVFNSKQATYIVTGDSGFALLQDMTRQEITLPQYVDGDFDKWFPTFGTVTHPNGETFDADRLAGYTSVADLNAVVGILHLPESSQGRVVVRNAHDVHMGDLRESNLILLGGPHANPWAQLFGPNSQFRLELSPAQDARFIVNKHPRPGEQAEYHYVPNASPNLTYTIVSFLPNMDGSGHALLIEGLNIAATQAGANFVLDQNAMRPILAKARMKDGSIGRFEVLLETQSIGTSASEARPIVERYGAAETALNHLARRPSRKT